MSDRTLKEKNKNEASQKVVPAKSSEIVSNDTFLKRYKIIEKIGEGSYSEVLKCQNRETGTTVACKRLKHTYRSWGQVNEIAEIATLRTIQKHTNILQMMEIHYDEALGKVSLVFELMDVNLYELIKDRKRLLPESRVRTIMFQLFRALRHLHKLGIFHRDIKPENILIKLKTDQLKLGDLGSVRGIFSRPPYTEYISTRWYRSPECLLTAGHYSYKMDVWAAGCVFYEVLTLRPLFPGSSEIDQINRVNNILGPPAMKLLDSFHKQALMERESYRNQTQLNRRQHIQKVLDGYSSKYVCTSTHESKVSSTKSIKGSKNITDFYFTGKEGTGLDKILPSHITREAKEIIKACLAYDPEQRPTAQRIIQLSYFYELRESYAKNPEKVSSKPCLTICGENVVDQCDSIDLGTLGDRKTKRYHRGQPQKGVRESYKTSKESSKSKLSNKKPSSKAEVNNNKIVESGDNSVGSISRMSEASRIPAHKVMANGKILSLGKAGVLPSEIKIQSHHGSEHTSSKIPTSMARSKNRVIEVDEIKSTSSESLRSDKKHYKMTSMQQKSQHKLAEKSLSKLKSFSSTEKRAIKLPKVSDESLESLDTKLSKDTESCTTISKKENRRIANALNNNLSPSEENIGRKPRAVASQFVNKMEVVGKDIKKSVMPSDISPYVKAPSELRFLQKKIKADHKRPTNIPGQAQQQQSHPSQMYNARPQAVIKSESVKVSVVPPKVAAAALKYASSVNATNSAAVARQLREVLGDVDGQQDDSNATYSPDDTSYVASSVKIGKLRFRQKQQAKDFESPEKLHRSKIPLLIDDVETSRKPNKSTKLTSPSENSRNKQGTTDKWRNTGIPRMIPMSPEREKNIRLIRESLTLDKNKRLKIRQEAINNSHKNSFDYNPPPVNAQDALAQQRQQRTGETYSSGRYLNSTTDYENLDMQETSSGTAQADGRIFNQRSTRITLPDLNEEVKKPTLKSSELYHPEILDIYSSRYRGPDVNMNILKDANYVKHQDRAQEVKEKLNHRIQARRQKNSSVGDHPIKLSSERNSSYDYGQYSSAIGSSHGVGVSLTRDEERQRLRKASNSGRIERRPPVPPGKLLSLRHTDVNKTNHYREPSPEGLTLRGGHLHQTRLINGATGMSKDFPPDKSTKSRRTADPLRKDYKNPTKRRTERMKSTMRDDVFCSSDDDIVISMRKKFDNLISERAKRLSESLKTNTMSEEKELKKAYDSRSEEDVSVDRSKNDKPKKYARRELRARMAESLTSNNFATWRSKIPELRIAHGLIDNVSNNSGDFVPPVVYETGILKKADLKFNAEKQNPPARIDIRASRHEYHNSNLKYQRPSSRIYPFSHQDNRGRIYTPPGNKPVYQSAQLGTMLHERKLRYSHNTPVPISGQSNFSQRRSIIKKCVKFSTTDIVSDTFNDTANPLYKRMN